MNEAFERAKAFAQANKRALMIGAGVFAGMVVGGIVTKAIIDARAVIDIEAMTDFAQIAGETACEIGETAVETVSETI